MIERAKPVRAGAQRRDGRTIGTRARRIIYEKATSHLDEALNLRHNGILALVALGSSGSELLERHSIGSMKDAFVLDIGTGADSSPLCSAYIASLPAQGFRSSCGFNRATQPACSGVSFAASESAASPAARPKPQI